MKTFPIAEEFENEAYFAMAGPFFRSGKLHVFPKKIVQPFDEIDGILLEDELKRLKLVSFGEREGAAHDIVLVD